jgi:hypothetical protein
VALTQGQKQFRDLLAARTGLDRSVIGAWMLAEESGGAAQARERQGNQNWLNIGYFDSGPGAITKSKVFSDPRSAAEATAQFLKGEKFGASPGIRKILSARGQSPQAQVQAIASSGWATNPQYGRNISNLLGQGGSGGGGTTAPIASAASAPTTTRLPGATFKTTVPTVDQSAFEGARRNAIIGQLIARRNPNSILLRSGLLSTVEPSLGEFMGQQTTTSRVPGKTVTTPGGMSTPSPSVGPSMPGRRGKVILAPNADRAGVKIKPKVTSFVAAVAGSAGHPITIGTGTNHNQFVLGTHNQSDHWTGDAADLPQPVDSHQGDMVAAHALQQAGVPWSQAVQMARKGGVFNVTPKSGPWKGHRVQVLWKTMVGGNHHNHVHVGIR